MFLTDLDNEKGNHVFYQTSDLLKLSKKEQNNMTMSSLMSILCTGSKHHHFYQICTIECTEERGGREREAGRGGNFPNLTRLQSVILFLITPQWWLTHFMLPPGHTAGSPRHLSHNWTGARYLLEQSRLATQVILRRSVVSQSGTWLTENHYFTMKGRFIWGPNDPLIEWLKF